MNTVKTMTLEEEVGVPKHKRPNDCGENYIQMLWTGRVL